ncbi:MAG: hypothetical protein LBK63_07130 [Treponema sp.]|jgi:hypothetical protein|nr:hypothetical protein [Treponema sp.]
MKKVSILLLLITVLVSFSFAQVTVVGGFELDNVTGGNDGKLDPALWTEFYGSASKELGPGSIGADLGLGAKLHFSDEADSAYSDAGDVFLKGSYTLPAGPGDLAIGISTWHRFSNLSFGVDYDGIAAGPVAIGVGVGYDFNTSGITDDNPPKPQVFADPDNAVQDTLTARLSADFDFGLGIVYKFQYGIGGKDVAGDDASGVAKIVYLDVNYKVMDPLVVGLELDNTGDEFKAFQLKPYGNYSISDNTTLGISVKIANINNDVDGADDILITPGLTIKHVF